MSEPNHHIVRQIVLQEATLSLRSDDIIQVFYHDRVLLDVSLQAKINAALLELTDGKKLPFLFEAGDGVIVTAEARDNAVKMENETPSVGYAVIVQNMAYRLTASFYLKFNKPKKPYKVFTDKDRDKAIEWLLSLRS